MTLIKSLAAKHKSRSNTLMHRRCDAPSVSKRGNANAGEFNFSFFPLRIKRWWPFPPGYWAGLLSLCLTSCCFPSFASSQGKKKGSSEIFFYLESHSLQVPKHASARGIPAFPAWFSLCCSDWSKPYEIFSVAANINDSVSQGDRRHSCCSSPRPICSPTKGFTQQPNGLLLILSTCAARADHTAAVEEHEGRKKISSLYFRFDFNSRFIHPKCCVI